MSQRRRLWLSLLGIAVVTALAVAVVIPKAPDLKLPGMKAAKELKIHEGLDLEGGSHLVYTADMSKVPDSERQETLDGIKQVVEERVNRLGVSEPLVQSNKSGDDYRLIVELPGVTDVAAASKSIGETTTIEFREQAASPDPAATDPLSVTEPSTAIKAENFKRATVQFNQQTSQPELLITFDGEGAKKFADLTRRNVNKPIYIIRLPDGTVISAPNVQQEITAGEATITGSFTVEETKELATKLNSGRLPTPLSLVEQRSVGPTLGEESVQKSLAAGLIGLFLVAAFMIVFYRLPGVLAVLALLVYTAVMIALFKLIPVTLTLAGIAGFILSIGIAVDANILIFERMKEELRAGQNLSSAVKIGFKRAFPSIRDSNAASLLMGAVLYTGGGSVRGFAVVLMLGVGVSLFSAITVTRTFTQAAARTRLGNRLTWWGLRKSEAAHVA